VILGGGWRGQFLVSFGVCGILFFGHGLIQRARHKVVLSVTVFPSCKHCIFDVFSSHRIVYVVEIRFSRGRLLLWVENSYGSSEGSYSVLNVGDLRTFSSFASAMFC